MDNCVFCKIRKGEIPGTILYKDEDFMIIKNIAPSSKVHLLAIPTEHAAYIADISEKSAELLGKMMSKISHMQQELGLTNGYRLIINQGEDAGQTVGHIHIHIMGGEKLAEF